MKKFSLSKMKLIKYIFIFIFINSSQTKKISIGTDIIENVPFSKSDFYKYDSGYLRDNIQKSDSFRSNIYTIVEPLDENKRLPKKINALPFDTKRWKKSVDYFEKKLKGKNLSYLEINNKIVVRRFYSDYRFRSKKDISILTDVDDLKKHLELKKLNYEIHSIKKIDSTDIIDVEIQSKLYKIILNKNLCESYLFYNKKDTVNYNLYRNVIVDFYR